MKQEIFFETIKCDDGSVYNLDYHIKRVAKTIGLNINLNEYIHPISDDLLKCKVIYNNFGIVNITYEPYQKKNISSFKIAYNNTINYKYKSQNRDEINKLFSTKNSADEIIIFKNGLLTDTSIANIAIFKDNIWQTPKSPLLEGTTRARLIDEKILIPKDITLKDLKSASKIALLNAMVDMQIIEDYSFFEG